MFKKLKKFYPCSGSGIVAGVLAAVILVLLVLGGSPAMAQPQPGSPVGCIFLTALPNISTNGQKVSCQTDFDGSTRYIITGFSSNTKVGMSGYINFPELEGTRTPAPFGVETFLYNPTTSSEDAELTNYDTPALTTLSSAAAGTTNSATQINVSNTGVQVGVNLTTVTTATVTVNLQGQDVASGVWYTILASTGLTTAGFTNLTVHPGAATTANVSSPQPLPRNWRVQVVIVGASAAVTGTVGASVIR